MKNHNVPASSHIPLAEGGVVKHSPRGFNWEKACKRALAKKQYRSIQLARTNPDYRMKYPNECRDNPECKVLTECHPEAQKRILEEHEKILQLAIVPPVDRPKRMNRLG